MAVAEEPQRVMRTHLKSRTGCKTCKIRRIKCDETQPACQRCSKSGWKCDGVLSTTRPAKTSVDFNTVVSSRMPCFVKSVSTSIGDPEEQRAFCFFRETTAPMLSTFTAFTDYFWKTTIPQVSHSEAVIWHMLVAIGSRQEQVSSAPYRPGDVDHLYMKHYSQALRIATQSKREQAVEVVLMACMMFIVWENVQDIATFTSGGLFHLISGLNILREWRRCCGTDVRPRSGIIRTVIEPMFAQLEIVLSVFSMPPSVMGIVGDPQEAQPQLLTSFPSLLVAQKLFIDIWRWRFQQRGAWTASSTAFKEVQILLVRWHGLLVSYVRALPDEEMMEKQRGATLIAQYRLLYLALVYSTRTDVPETHRVRPSLVDLSHPGKISLIYVLPPCATSEQFDLIWRGAVTPAQDQIRLWPITETAQSSGHRGLIRLTSSSTIGEPNAMLETTKNEQ